MTDYKDQLNHPLWIEKRNKIRTRDNQTCQHCGTNSIKSRKSYDKLFGDTQSRNTKNGNEIRTKSISLDELTKWAGDNVNLANFHVHHLYYVSKKMAWEYPDRALLTLCASCHEKVHNENSIKSFKTQEEADRLYHKIFSSSKAETKNVLKSQNNLDSKNSAKKNNGCLICLLLISLIIPFLI